MSTWKDRTDVPTGATYDERWARLAATGAEIHGEADRVELLVRDRFEPRPDSQRAPIRILDAGCGTGRVAVELANRGFEVVGADNDIRMLDTAKTKSASVTWVEADLSTLNLDGAFEAIVAAGNVMIFVAPGSESAVVGHLAAHLVPTGLLVAGFQLTSGLSVERYDEIAGAHGLVLVARMGTWDGEPFFGGDYAVSVHARA